MLNSSSCEQLSTLSNFPKTAILSPFFILTFPTKIIELCQILPEKGSYILKGRKLIMNSELEFEGKRSLREGGRWIYQSFHECGGGATLSSRAQVVTLGRASSCLVLQPLQKNPHIFCLLWGVCQVFSPFFWSLTHTHTLPMQTYLSGTFFARAAHLWWKSVILELYFIHLLLSIKFCTLSSSLYFQMATGTLIWSLILRFIGEIAGRPKSMRFMHQASYYVVKIVDNIFGILPHKNICICLLLILDKLAAGAVLLAPLLLRETQ